VTVAVAAPVRDQTPTMDTMPTEMGMQRQATKTATMEKEINQDLLHLIMNRIMVRMDIIAILTALTEPTAPQGGGILVGIQMVRALPPVPHLAAARIG
jgi:hypothetical protein